MKRRLFQLFTIVGAITVGLLVVTMLVSIVRCATGDRVAKNTVLELRLDRALAESNGDPLQGLFAERRTTLTDVIEALQRAGDDDHIAGVVVHIADVEYGFANVQEIRDAIERFRGKGKWAIAHADSFGELGPGNQGYYLATACDEIWLQPTGAVGLTGLASEAMFVRGTLDMLGIKPHGDHRKEYKNALNMFTERRFTPAHREAAQTIIDDLFGQMVRDIAARRQIDESKLRALIDDGPFLAARALELGLVDGLAYRDEVITKVKARADGGKLLYADPYLERAGRPWENGRKVIALVQGAGPVTRGPSQFDLLSGEASMGADTITAGFAAAIDDDDVVAIVFRIDTPGGSAVASDAIWRETQRAKDAGKPVIVSMGNVAASGGYYVSAGATKILAQPGTVTGSIGVLGGKPVLRDAWNKIGVTWDVVSTSKNATMFSTLHEYDAGEWKQLQTWLDQVYVDFTGKVASGRGLSAEKVEALAKGRVWTGERALALGLVDELGGLVRAIDLAREAAGLDADTNVRVAEYPRDKSLWERLLSGGPESSEPERVAARIEADLARWRPIASALREAMAADPETEILRMPSLPIGR